MNFLGRQPLTLIVFILCILTIHINVFAKNNDSQTFGIIKDDFLVNDDIIGPCRSEHPDVAIGSSGNFAICWSDRRDVKPRVYLQVYDPNGNKIGNNFNVIDVIAGQGYPRIGADSTGNSTIVWCDDSRDPNGDIFCRQFSASGSPIGSHFIVNDDTILNKQYTPEIAVRLDGSFVIVWHDTREGGIGKIYAQRYDFNGNPLGSNFKIRDATTSWFSVAADSIGNFYVTWSQGVVIYARKYDCDGNPVTDWFQVSDSSTAIDTDACPSVACSNEGRFVISWTDKRNDLQWWYDIYAQLYDESCNPIGVNFRVNDDTTQKHQCYSSAGMDAAGDFLICWEDRRTQTRMIYAQRFDSLGTRIDTNFVISDNPNLDGHLHPRVAMNSHGDFVATWQKIPGYWYPDVIAQRYDRYANPIDNNFTVNDDTAASQQTKQCIATYPSKGHIIAWKDNRDTTYSFYYQMFDSLGNSIGTNKQALMQNSFELANLDASMDGHGNFGFVWEELFSLRCQLFDSIGNPIGNNFGVTSGDYLKYHAIAKDWTGNFVISWVRDDPRDVYAKRYDSLGNQIGSSFKVNIGQAYVDYTDVAKDSCGNFVIVWCDNDSACGVFGQRYDRNGNQIGNNFRISDDTLQYVLSPSLDMNLHGNFVVVWQDWNIYHDIFAQIFDSLGTPVGSNIKVNSTPLLDQPVTPSVAVHPRQDKFVVFWTDWRNQDGDPEVFAQLYENGAPIGANVQINNPDSFPYNRQGTTTHSIDATESGVFFTWFDCRRHKGADTYAKITDWELVGCNEFSNQNIVNILFEIYPSISTSFFTIEYMIHESNAPVRLNIYDVSGRIVREFSESSHQPFNQIIWDGRDNSGQQLSSGVYFITFRTADYKETKKAVLVR